MKIYVKIFLTYASISMLIGMFLMMFTMANIIPYHAMPNWVIFVTWLGPTMLALSVGLPIALWKMWSKI